MNMKKNSLNILGLTLVFALVLAGCGANPNDLAKQTYNLYQESIAAADNPLKLSGVIFKAASLGKKVNKLSGRDRQIYNEELERLGGARMDGLFDIERLSGLFGIEGLGGLFRDGGGSAQSDGSGYVTVANTGGRLTINGLSQFEGKWVYAAAVTDNANDDLVLFASDSVTNSVISCARISNGSATLNVWKHTEANDNSIKFDNYSGSDNLQIAICVVNKAAITRPEADDMSTMSSGGIPSFPDWMKGSGLGAASFANGRATVTPYMLVDLENLFGGIDLDNLFDGIDW